MKAVPRTSLYNVLRGLSAVVAYLFLFNQLAHAATLPPHIAMALHRATSTHVRALPVAVGISQQPLSLGEQSPEAAVRARLQSAHTLYVVDDGSDENFPLSPTAGYNLFVATLQSWGRYTLVDSASKADLVLQLHNVVHTSVQDGTHRDPSATVYYEPEFRLTIADPQTLKPLWSFVLPVITGTRKHDKADMFALSVQNVTSQLKVLAGDSLTPTESAALYPPPERIGHGRLILGISALAALLALPALLFLNSKKHAEEDQHQFCVEHGLPC